MTDVRIRIASSGDAAAVNAVYEHYITHTVATFNERNKTVEERAAEMDTLLQRYPFLIAEDTAGRFLGFACAEPIRMQTGYRYCAELTIYLHPDAPKGAGVGSVLYTYLLHLLREMGFCRAVGVIHAGNDASIALHKRFGFTQAALFPAVAYKHGRWLDAALYALQLHACEETPAALLSFSEYRKKLAFEPACPGYLKPLEKTQE